MLLTLKLKLLKKFAFSLEASGSNLQNILDKVNINFLDKFLFTIQLYTRMTFSDVLNRALKRWWIIVIAIVISTLAFFPWSTDTLFKASIGIGVSLNSPELEKRDNVRTDFSGS